MIPGETHGQGDDIPGILTDRVRFPPVLCRAEARPRPGTFGPVNPEKGAPHLPLLKIRVPWEPRAVGDELSSLSALGQAGDTLVSLARTHDHRPWIVKRPRLSLAGDRFRLRPSDPSCNRGLQLKRGPLKGPFSPRGQETATLAHSLKGPFSPMGQEAATLARSLKGPTSPRGQESATLAADTGLGAGRWAERLGGALGELDAAFTDPLPLPYRKRKLGEDRVVRCNAKEGSPAIGPPAAILRKEIAATARRMKSLEALIRKGDMYHAKKLPTRVVIRRAVTDRTGVPNSAGAKEPAQEALISKELAAEDPAASQPGAPPGPGTEDPAVGVAEHGQARTLPEKDLEGPVESDGVGSHHSPVHDDQVGEMVGVGSTPEGDAGVTGGDEVGADGMTDGNVGTAMAEVAKDTAVAHEDNLATFCRVLPPAAVAPSASLCPALPIARGPARASVRPRGLPLLGEDPSGVQAASGGTDVERADVELVEGGEGEPLDGTPAVVVVEEMEVSEDEEDVRAESEPPVDLTTCSSDLEIVEEVEDEASTPACRPSKLRRRLSRWGP
jgi:hypothetical protein